MSRQMMADSKRCGHCYIEIPQIGSKDKNFCDAKCNNDNYSFRNNVLPKISDPELRQCMEEQLRNNVPTIILAHLAKNWNREQDKLVTKKRHSNQIACFYKNVTMNLTSLISEKSIHVVKQQIVV